MMSSRHVLCVLGTGLDLGAVETAAAREGFGLDWEYSVAQPDPSVIPLYRALVKRPISDGLLHYSCGMHLLGAPDIEVDLAHDPGPAGIAGLIDALALYLLTECRAEEIEDGEGFRSAPGEPRWILGHRPCDRYDEDDIFFNPHGYLRMTPG